MYEIFGNFDSVEELNACAEGLLAAGDAEKLMKLAKENGIPDFLQRITLIGLRKMWSLQIGATLPSESWR